MANAYPTRRTVLRGVATGAIGSTFVGQSAADQPDRYVVGVHPDRGLNEAKNAAAEVRREIDFGDIGTAVAGRFSEQAIEALQRNPNVRYVEPDSQYRATAQTTPTGVETIGATLAHETGETGDGAHVAVIDSGIDSTHEDLVDNLGEGTSFVACGECSASGNVNACTEAWDDDYDHGTHVAGIVAAADNDVGVVGVAPESTLHPVKVLDCVGNGTLSDLAAAIAYVADQGWDVANMSLAGTTRDQTLADACQYAADRGVLLVAATGNFGPCSDCVGYPAAFDTVIAVTAVDDEDVLVERSATGSEVELAAPGVDVVSTIPDTDGYAADSGTSMAAPFVSGAGALLVASGYTTNAARNRLLETAVDVGLADDEQGSGRLDVAAALDLDGGSGGDGGDGGDGDDGGDGNDGGDDDGTSDAVPNVDDVTISSRTSGPWTRAEVEWTVSHPDGGLETVTSELLDGSTVIDSMSSSVEGTSATGIHELRTRASPDAIRVTVVDGAGTEYSETYGPDGNEQDGGDGGDDGDGSDGGDGSDDGDGSDGGDGGDDSPTDAEPSIEDLSITTRTSGPWTRVEVEWTVSHPDGGLEIVTSELLDGSTVLNSVSSSVDGASASGVHELRTRDSPDAVRLTVVDELGNERSSFGDI